MRRNIAARDQDHSGEAHVAMVLWFAYHLCRIHWLPERMTIAPMNPSDSSNAAGGIHRAQAILKAVRALEEAGRDDPLR